MFPLKVLFSKNLLCADCDSGDDCGGSFQLFRVAACFYFRSPSVFIVTYYVCKKIDRNDVTYKFSEPVLGLIPKMSAIASRVLKSSVCDSCTV